MKSFPNEDVLLAHTFNGFVILIKNKIGLLILGMPCLKLKFGGLGFLLDIKM
jgi:hypothetical protein